MGNLDYSEISWKAWYLAFASWKEHIYKLLQLSISRQKWEIVQLLCLIPPPLECRLCRPGTSCNRCASSCEQQTNLASNHWLSDPEKEIRRQVLDSMHLPFTALRLMMLSTASQCTHVLKSHTQWSCTSLELRQFQSVSPSGKLRYPANMTAQFHTALYHSKKCTQKLTKCRNAARKI